MKQVLLRGFIPLISVMILASACEKRNIQFATELGETYTNLFETDTVGIEMSTFFVDSFPTNSLTEFIAGAYYDSILGKITTKPFMQFSFPAVTEMESGAIYDSLVLVLKMKKTWYGDTITPVTFNVHELNAPIDYVYGNYIFNNTMFGEYAASLGSRTVRMYPSVGDSVIIRLSDTKGADLFNKFVTQDQAVLTSDAFENYFRGISVDASAYPSNSVYTMPAGADSIYIRLHYHTNTPYHTAYSRDIKQNGTDHCNYINSDRTGTIFQGKGTLVPSTSTNNFSVSQPAAGTLLKMSFPSLREMLKTDPTLKLLSATLQLQVTPSSESAKYPLPATLYLASTDASNTVGEFLSDSTGSALLAGHLAQDKVYDYGSQYEFNVTSFMKSLLSTDGSENIGFFLMQEEPGTTSDISRVVINNSSAATKRSKLVLSFLTLKTQ